MELFEHESEIAVLSILLRKPEALFEGTPLRSEYFSSTQHRMVYDTVRDLISENLVPDPSVILERLRSRGNEEFISAEFLKGLLRKDYNEANYKEYVSNVIDSYIAKNLLNLGGHVTQELNNKRPVRDVLSDVAQRLSDLSNRGGGESTRGSDELAADYEKYFIERIENPSSNFMSIGLADVDAVVGGIAPGELWIIAARPGQGKSALMITSLWQSAKRGIPVLLFSKEMNWESVFDRMVSMSSHIPLSDLRRGLVVKGSQDFEKVQKSIQEIKSLPIYIDANFSADIDYVCSVIRKYHTQAGVKIAHIDYAQLLSERDEGATHELGRISKALKLLASELGIGIVLASQLNRGVEMRENKRPILSDIRQSGNLEEDSDLVAFLYRDEMYNPDTDRKGMMEYIIRKQRNGATGTITLKFDHNTTRVY